MIDMLQQFIKQINQFIYAKYIINIPWLQAQLIMAYSGIDRQVIDMRCKTGSGATGNRSFLGLAVTYGSALTCNLHYANSLNTYIR